MIIEKKTTGVLVVPVLQGIVITSEIHLLGGMNEVDDKTWGDVRDSVMPHKSLIEHHVVSEKKEEVKEKYTIKNKDNEEEIRERTKVIYKISARKFGKLSAEEALEIVEKTYSLDLLNKWKKAAGKESVRIAVMARLKKLKKGKLNKKPKKRIINGYGFNHYRYDRTPIRRRRQQGLVYRPGPASY